MFGSAICFSLTTFSIKVLAGHLPVLEVGFLRCFMSLFALVPILGHHGLSAFKTNHPKTHITRIVCATFGVLLAIYGLQTLELATAVSLSFTRPLFMIVLAHFLLNEPVQWRRGLATVMGFIGVLIVLGPSDVSDIPGAVATLTAAAFIAGSLAVIRKQAGVDGPATIMAWYSIGTCCTTLVPALFVWQWPTMHDALPLAALAVLGSGGQYMIVRAFAEGEATVVNPIDYSQLIMATIIGFVAFGELPTIWTFVGSAVIIASTLYILFREARIKKAAAYAKAAA
jgi:drug/metabolite transporter (DMT)-like permease